MSEFFQVALDVIMPIFFVAALGFWFGRQFKPDPHTLSRLAFYIFFPPLVFQGVARSDMPPEAIGRLMLLVFLVFISLACIAWLLSRSQTTLSPITRSAFILSSMMGNTGNYGLPFVAFAFSEYGDQAVQISVIVFVTATLINQTLGIYIASSGTATMAQGIRNVLSVPVPYAAALGLVVNLAHIAMPLPLNRALDLMAQAAMPLMLVLLGVQLSRISVQEHLRPLLRPLTMSAGTRLLVAPAVFMILAPILNVSGLPRNVALVQLSMPTAVTAALLATEFDSDAQYVSAAILISTLTSLLTLSAIMTLFVF